MFRCCILVSRAYKLGLGLIQAIIGQLYILILKHMYRTLGFMWYLEVRVVPFGFKAIASVCELFGFKVLCDIKHFELWWWNLHDFKCGIASYLMLTCWLTD